MASASSSSAAAAASPSRPSPAAMSSRTARSETLRRSWKWGAQQSELEAGLRLGAGARECPAQQLVRLEGVPHHRLGHRPVGARIVHREAGPLRRREQGVAHGGDFGLRAAVDLGDVLRLRLALGRHVGVELERHPPNVDGHLAFQLLHRAGELGVADGAPRAHHVRPDIDLQRVHQPFSSHHFSMKCAIARSGGGTKLVLSGPRGQGFGHLGAGEPARILDLGFFYHNLARIGEAMAAEHQLRGERPGLAGDVGDVAHPDARLLEHFARHCFLDRFARLDEPGERRIALRRKARLAAEQQVAAARVLDQHDRNRIDAGGNAALRKRGNRAPSRPWRCAWRYRSGRRSGASRASRRGCVRRRRARARRARAARSSTRYCAHRPARCRPLAGPARRPERRRPARGRRFLPGPRRLQSPRRPR